MPAITNFYQQAIDYLSQIAAGGGSGGGSGTPQQTIEDAIESAENLQNLSEIVADIDTLRSVVINIFNAVQAVNVDMGAYDSGASTSDIGHDGLIGLIKRLLSVKLPNSVNGRIPVAQANPISSYAQGSVAVATSSVTVASANSSRKQLLIVNRGTSVCYLSFGASASTTTGIPLNPASTAGLSGGVYDIDSSNLFTGEINAICASGSTTLVVAEGS